MRIDAHLHFWRYAPGEYPWISTAMPELRRDWTPDDAAPLLKAQGMDGGLAVQARASEAETDFLLDLAATSDWIEGVVGWVDLFSRDLTERLDRHRQSRALVGYRHLLQDDPDVAATLADTKFNLGVAALQDRGKVYEVLVRGAEQLQQAVSFCARHDRHWLVLDHLGKPSVGGDQDPVWLTALGELAAMPHVAVKASGLAAELAAGHSDINMARPYLDRVLERFGARRMMFGSDWPVCLLQTTYADWAEFIRNWSGQLSPTEQAQLWGETALKCYGLPHNAIPETAP